VTRTGSCCLLVGSVAIAALAGGHDLAADILVGFAGPLTGEMELAGEQMQNGTKLAVAELNAAGGLLGQKIVIDHVDDHCDGEQAVAAARKLVADRVAVAIGHLCSNAAIPASGVYEAARIPFITMAANPLVTGRGLRWTFRGSPPDDANARFTAAYMVRQLAAKRIGIVHDTRTYGKGLAQLTRKSLEELGMPPVLFEAAQPEQLLFADLIERLQRAGIDVLYYGGYPREVGLLRRQLAEAGFLPPMITAATNTSEEYGLIAGPAAEGTLVVADRQFNTPEFSQFEASLRAAYRRESDLRVTRGYSNARIWAQAVVAAGTTDGTAVAQALRSGTFHVFGIEARFDDQGNVQGPLGEATVWVWQGGKPVPLPSESLADSKVKPSSPGFSGDRVN
jgi:branched-chain amino acid transport system substrate-binding protein